MPASSLPPGARQRSTQIVWDATIAGLSALPALAIPLGFLGGDPVGISRTATLAFTGVIGMLFVLRRTFRMLSPAACRPHLAVLALLMAVGAIGIAWGEADPVRGPAYLAAIAGALGAACGAYALSLQGVPALPRLWRWTVIGAAPMLALPLLVVLTIDRFEPSLWTHQLYGFSNPRSLGQYAAIAIAILAGMTAWHRGGPRPPARRAASMILLGAFWAILFWSGSRGGVLALAVAASCGAAILGLPGARALASQFGAAVAGLSASLLMPVPNGSYGMMDRLDEAVAMAYGEGAGSGIASGRVELWGWALERILEHPWIGRGFMHMSTIPAGERPPVAHAHNIVLDYAMGFGVPLTLAVLSCAFVLGRRAARGARLARHRAGRVPEGLAPAVLVAALLPAYSMVSGVLMNPYPLILMGAALGGMLGLAQAERWSLIRLTMDPEVHAHPERRAEGLGRVRELVSEDLGQRFDRVIDLSDDAGQHDIDRLARRRTSDFERGWIAVLVPETSEADLGAFLAWSRAKAIVPILVASEREGALSTGAWRTGRIRIRDGRVVVARV